MDVHVEVFEEHNGWIPYSFACGDEVDCNSTHVPKVNMLCFCFLFFFVWTLHPMCNMIFIVFAIYVAGKLTPYFLHRLVV